MPKIHMAQIAGVPVRTLRRLFGIPAHRPSAFNACIGGQLRGKKYSTPAAGMGGQRDVRIQSAFTAAVHSCGGKMAKAKA